MWRTGLRARTPAEPVEKRSSRRCRTVIQASTAMEDMMITGVSIVTVWVLDQDSMSAA